MPAHTPTPPFKRLFASVRPPHDWIIGATRIRRQLEENYGSAVRWSEPDSYHITVRFFGNVPADTADMLIAAWATLGQSALAAPIFFPEPCGCFPAERDPARVVWVGARASSEYGFILAHIDDHISNLGVVYQQDASIPHLTLGRIKQPDKIFGLRDKASAMLLSAKPFVAHEIELTLSTPGPSGSVYTRLAAFPLAGR